MKHIRQFVFAALMLLFALPAWAYDFEVDGIYYNITSNTVPYKVSVTRGTNYYSGNVTIPETISYNGVNYSVTSIGDGAFRCCEGLTSVTIPNSVTSIGVAAFESCKGLTSVTIPNSVTSIGNAAFNGCTGLTSVTIPNSVTSIGNAAFNGCTGLTSVTIPNSVTSIGNEAFCGCSGLTTVTIPNSVTSIGEDAFSGCSGLTSVTIPNSVTSINFNPFSNCTGLTSIVVASGNPKYDSRGNCNALIETETNCLISGCKTTVIPNSVTRILYYAFYGCTGMTSVTIPNSVTSIDGGAFLGCTGLISITIPNSVTSIGNNPFPNCTSLTSIVVASGNPKYDSRGNCNALIETETNRLISGCKTTVIPNSVTNIGNAAFNGCTGLTSVTIPNSVTNIGYDAFSYCSGLTSVTIPNSVTSIESHAFHRCTGLISVTIPNSVTWIGTWAFNGCTCLTSVVVKAATPPDISRDRAFPSQDMQFYVPCGSQESYQNSDWGIYFPSISEMDFSYQLDVTSSDEGLGLVNITQQPDCVNHLATVLAEPVNGSVFLNWTVDGQVVSVANPYTFAVENDVELVAVFSGAGVDEEASQTITVSPNPAHNYVNIECENMRSITLCTLDGRVSRMHKVNGDAFTVDMTDLANGIYILRIETQDGLVVNRKIVKE